MQLVSRKKKFKMRVKRINGNFHSENHIFILIKYLTMLETILAVSNVPYLVQKPSCS